MIKRWFHKVEHRMVGKDRNRIARPFEWGIEFLDRSWVDPVPRAGSGTESSLNGDRRTDVFRFNENAIADSDAFFGLDAVPRFSLRGEWLTFPSPVQTPYDENNTAYGRFFPVRSNDISFSTRRDEAERAMGRAVIVLPQWNADITGHVALCRLLNRSGIAALRFSLPYHDRRMLTGFQRADYLISANIGRTLQACRQAVLETRAGLEWLISQGYHRVGVIGTSIGSCIAFLTFVHELRLRVGVFNHVSSYFGDVVWAGLSTAHVRPSLEKELTREEVRRAWLAISPNSYVSRLAGDERRGLMISGRYDLTFTPDLSKLLFDACDRHGVPFDRKVAPWGHYTVGVAPFKYIAGLLIAAYFRKHL